MLRGSIALMAARCVTLGVGFLGLIAVSRVLGPDGFGQLSYALAFVALIAPLSECGLNAVVVKALVRTPERRGAILGSALAIRVAAATAVIVIGYLAVGIFRPGDEAVQRLVSILLLAEMLRTLSVFSFDFEARENFLLIALITGAVAVLAAVAKIGIALTGGSLAILIWVYAAEAAVLGPVFLIAVLVRRRPLRLSLDPSLVKGVGPAIGVLAVSGFLATMNLRIDQVMIGQILGDDAAGSYAVAARLSEIWYFVPSIIATAAMPGLLRLHASSQSDLHARVARLLDMLFLLGLAVATVTSVLAAWAINLLFGQQYAAAAPILALHVWGGIFVAWRAIASKWIVLHDCYRMSLVSHGVGAVLNIVLNLLLLPVMGAMGAAVATVISYAVSGYVMFFFHPQTRALAVQMTLSTTAPFALSVRWIARLVETGKSKREG